MLEDQRTSLKPCALFLTSVFLLFVFSTQSIAGSFSNMVSVSSEKYSCFIYGKDRAYQFGLNRAKQMAIRDLLESKFLAVYSYCVVEDLILVKDQIETVSCGILKNQKWDALEADKNPFSVVIMAHLKAQELGKGKEEQLKIWKLKLSRMLYERGYKRKDILELFRFIDWLMILPDDLEKAVP